MAKGGNFELEVAKKLSLWLSYGKRDDLICRTDSSGGRATVRTKKKKETNKYLYGDLKHSDDVAKRLFDSWSIECKTGYATKSKLKDGTKKVVNWDVLDVLDSKKKAPMISVMWEQCVRDAQLSLRWPILIFRRNQKDICIATNSAHHLRMYGFFGSPKYNIIDVKITTDAVCAPNDMITIMRFNDFLEWVDPKALLEIEAK